MINALVNELLPELLPEIVMNISDLTSYRAALKLVQAFGGIKFAMPLGDRDSKYYQKLIDAIGHDDAKTLIKNYGGDLIYIPCCHAALIQLRNQEFRNAVVAAVTDGAIQTAAIHLYAPQFGFTERWAYKVLSEENKRYDRQLNLFN